MDRYFFKEGDTGSVHDAWMTFTTDRSFELYSVALHNGNEDRLKPEDGQYQRFLRLYFSDQLVEVGKGNYLDYRQSRMK